MTEIIRIENVSKKFGDVTALENVDLSMEKGKIYGIVGRNGSGKTVLFKLITGFLKPTKGRVTVCGKEIGKDIDFADNIGIIIENPGFLKGYTGFKNLTYLAGIRNVIGKEEIRESMKKVGLDPDSRKKVGKYSLGMKQRLGIAQAIMENPEILILDVKWSMLFIVYCVYSVQKKRKKRTPYTNKS
ncbi:MAG: ABC transporter ATP-binding protein [Lachnospiraceae bacterium]|nr:ABC transporter ATP-binding protein [Lachnospiraceae bacterium]